MIRAISKLEEQPSPNVLYGNVPILATSMRGRRLQRECAAADEAHRVRTRNYNTRARQKNIRGTCRSKHEGGAADLKQNKTATSTPILSG